MNTFFLNLLQGKVFKKIRNKMSNIFMLLCLLVFLSVANCDNSSKTAGIKTENVRDRLFKRKNGPCWRTQYRCQNNKCIERHQFCNGRNDCGDNSDENYCRTSYNCPNQQDFMKCRANTYDGYQKCVPVVWKCDGIKDCADGLDENGCGDVSKTRVTPNQITKAINSARNWILNERSNGSRIQKWGFQVPRSALAFYFSSYSNLTEEKNVSSEISYELSLSLLSKFALKDIEDVRTSELALYVNSLLAYCINPRKFYMVDLIKELRKRVNAQKSANPYAILALCNAQDTITSTDAEKLLTEFQKANVEHRTDTQAIIVMALACAAAQPESSFDREELSDYTMEIKKKQYRNGTVENVKTTALVLQALFASEFKPDEDNFDEERAIMQILRSQEADGSFGGLMNTYYVLPVLSMSSLANISGKSCPKLDSVETEGLDYLKIQVGEKWNVSYSIWIGDDKILQRSLTLSVPANTSFYGVMEYAAGVDEKYKFEYNIRNRRPYIYSLSGIMDDPEMEMFWYPYYLLNNSSQPILISKSPADVIPDNNDHVLYWYRKVL